MSAKHTPGPWVFCDSNGNPQPFSYTGPGFYDNPAIYGADGTMIVGCDEYDVFERFKGDPRREANIMLMVEAPQLLAALQRVYDFLDANYADYDMPDILPAVRAAIAAATGEGN